MKFIALANHNKILYLQAVEKGWVTLIGATTENPSFEVIPASIITLSSLYVLNPFDKDRFRNCF